MKQMSDISLPSSAAAVPSEQAVAPRFKYDGRFTAPLLITGILVVGQLTFGFLESYTKTALAIITSIVIELVLGRLFTGKWPHLASAYITGISVGILVRSPELWPYALCSAISITSKYVIRVKGRHIWNPSNLGICVMLFLASYTVASLSIQWGNYLWPMLIIWTLGSIIIWRLKRFHICATYVISFLIFSFLRSWITGHPWQAEFAPITGPMYQLFVFFMITDPKTTVHSKWGQCVVAFCVALVEMVLRLAESVHAPYYSLFLVGPTANLIEIWWTSRRGNTPSEVTSTTELATMEKGG
jgi:Na+-translocating ferredoxin:NAD+ oxidoreductase RnfD subunit